jgi:hypothetical protein
MYKHKVFLAHTRHRRNDKGEMVPYRTVELTDVVQIEELKKLHPDITVGEVLELARQDKKP